MRRRRDELGVSDHPPPQKKIKCLSITWKSMRRRRGRTRGRRPEKNVLSITLKSIYEEEGKNSGSLTRKNVLSTT
jgi:hypothetical protein